MYRKFFASVLILMVLMAALTGCNSSASAPKETTDNTAVKKTGEKITVAAAADLALAFKEIGDLYEQTTGNEAEITFSSSGTAREQIANGAPYDVYASANIKYVDDLIAQDKIIADSKELYAIGRVGAATLVSSPLQIKEASDLLKPEFKKIAIANPDHAPYGVAAKEALESMGLWDKLKDKMVYGKDIQDVLTMVKTGNVEAGLISLSVVNKNEVNFLLFDDKLHKPLKQAIAVVKGTQHEKAAREFIKFVNGEQGREIMKKYGFVLPGEV
ncbi:MULTISPECIES: molybdate ABC transporter substrate-binding protein [Dehalobacter]|uniref:Molybdate ABC transporter substrate-binding protein n=2 Tax=Dehalobacter restrictus TaxID=55583 RepID=A0A857DFH4_9FIRM|nr:MULTISPECIES: molybdate ABC transporter substrate-binding protein [Dehalobacter]AHF08930.1 molybdenum ABC transporter substrate-binding protein [Dehalobacter restrictus DSM 9455]MCG1026060.1 molybdate ABC transporter substrate-binding protein [Dehalobacter sp.]MDJ0306678.1 molybdate ABC transporter substrate-binding protein [Dehalobacter sp.]OCZ50912.1 molybdate ABC transporter substrate-binding protein [Dehalobacter sp. TeCB1]QGZ99450.1 molybdate ABC transporter substrate-binding protein [